MAARVGGPARRKSACPRSEPCHGPQPPWNAGRHHATGLSSSVGVSLAMAACGRRAGTGGWSLLACAMLASTAAQSCAPDGDPCNYNDAECCGGARGGGASARLTTRAAAPLINPSPPPPPSPTDFCYGGRCAASFDSPCVKDSGCAIGERAAAVGCWCTARASRPPSHLAHPPTLPARDRHIPRKSLQKQQGVRRAGMLPQLGLLHTCAGVGLRATWPLHAREHVWRTGGPAQQPSPAPHPPTRPPLIHRFVPQQRVPAVRARHGTLHL